MSSKPSQSCTISSKSGKSIVTENRNCYDDNELEDVNENQEQCVTRHLMIKPSGKLDKDTVLRRIRHRKRINNVKNVVQAFFGLLSSGKTDKGLVREKRWIDDVFSAP